jgi:hypothetical protein
MTIPVKYSGTPVAGTEPTLELKDASTEDASVSINDFVTLLLPFFHSSTHFGLAEAHTVDETTGEDAFIYAWNIGLVGVVGASNIPMSQTVVTFKTALGSLYRLYMMEGANTPNVKYYPPFGAGDLTDLCDFVTGNSSPIYGRKNAYPFTPIAYLTKTNDKLRKQQGND